MMVELAPEDDNLRAVSDTEGMLVADEVDDMTPHRFW